VTDPSGRVDDADRALDHVPDGPVPSSRAGDWLLDLVKVMARLRAPGGCPWDREQTHASLARHLLEEAHEALGAIDAGDRDALRDELGDVLLQVVFHAQMAADDGAWDVDDVAEGIVRKLIRRHPHVFGDVAVSGADEVLVNWERIKADEKGGSAPEDLEDDIPATLPALARAAKVQRRAAGWGFAFRTDEAAIAALRDEVAELEAAGGSERAEQEIGDVLFAAVAVARRLGVDAESALRRTTRGFAERYERFTQLVAERGLDVEGLGDAELRALFREARSPA
jgi:tetrapyrrole methylase family protein / MazG family protein